MNVKRFKCHEDCSLCCKSAGWVNISLFDLQRMSDNLNITKHTIVKHHCDVKPWVISRKLHSFGIKMRQPCPFLSEGKCSIYEARPDACRIFPYNHIMRDIKEWECATNVKTTPRERIDAKALEMNLYRNRLATEEAIHALKNIRPYIQKANIIQGEAIMHKVPLQVALHSGLQPEMEVVFQAVLKELEGME